MKQGPTKTRERLPSPIIGSLRLWSTLRPRRPPPLGCRRRALRLLPHHHAHPVGGAIVHEGDGGGIHGVAVHLGPRVPRPPWLGVGTGNAIAGAAEPQTDG